MKIEYASPTTNTELTELLQGSMMTAIAQQEVGKVELGFDDGTWIAVETDPGRAFDSSTPTGGVVEAVQQADGALSLALEGGETLEIPVAETAAVPVTVSEVGSAAVGNPS